MTTFGDALAALDDELLVGRQRELAACERWLTARPSLPELLHISGRGGVGKSALLRAFARRARQLGYPVVLADCRDIPQTSEGLLAALCPDAPDNASASLNATHPVVLLDTFEELGTLSRYLQYDLIPRLDSAVKIVTASRYPLEAAWTDGSSLRRLVRGLPLEGLSGDESREYLRRRGLRGRGLIEQIVGMAAGNPLMLALAADMALHLRIRDFGAAPEWRLSVRTLVERLLREVDDPALRELLEACAVVRQFDEASLAGVSGQEQVGAAFAQVCRMAVVRPTEHGLMLHDDVRHALAEDLRWRQPQRYSALRLRALSHFRERMRTAPPKERAWLVAERFYLCGNAPVQAVLFAADEPGQVWVEAARPDDHADLMRLWEFWSTHFSLPEGLVYDAAMREATRADNDLLLRYPGARLRIARGPDGAALGFSGAVPLCQESLPYLQNPVPQALIERYWSPAELAALPATPDATNAYFLLPMGYTDVLTEATRAALWREHFGLFALQGVYLLTVWLPGEKAMVEAVGFERVATFRDDQGREVAAGYVLDLSRLGVEGWIEALIAGRPRPMALEPVELEQELRAALLHWHDDGWLAQSPLARSAAVAAAVPEAEGPAGARLALTQTLARARAEASPDLALAYRALELAYLQHPVSHERAAERLSVSRATFYRLLTRGVRSLARALVQP